MDEATSRHVGHFRSAVVRFQDPASSPEQRRKAEDYLKSFRTDPVAAPVSLLVVTCPPTEMEPACRIQAAQMLVFVSRHHKLEVGDVPRLLEVTAQESLSVVRTQVISRVLPAVPERKETQTRSLTRRP